MKLKKISYFVGMLVIAAFLTIGLNSCGNQTAASEQETVAASTDDNAETSKCGEGKCGEGKCGGAEAGEKEVDMFASIDTDADGNITKEEFVAHRMAEFAKKDADGNDEIGKEECPMFDKFNTDGNDVLSKDEFFASNDIVFPKIDTDADGNVTRDEFTAFKASMAASDDGASKCGEGKCGEGKCGASDEKEDASKCGK